MDGNGVKEQLSDKQLRVIPHLLAAPSIEEGCKQAKVARATVYEWLKSEAFRDELKRHREEIVTGALETLKANVTKATGTLVGLLDSQNESIRHRTAKDIIEFTLRSAENENLEARIEALEERLKEQHGRWR
ncbi:MAG: hypothetical protein IH856_08095 [Deltaproteobacteria bacterium]|nr:hypothetical protein [Deltaproteobacteria bacterium]